MKEIFTLFNSEDKQEIRNAVKDLIIKQVEQDLEGNTYYLIDSDGVQDIINEAIEDIKEELKAEFKTKMMAKMQKQIEGMGL